MKNTPLQLEDHNFKVNSKGWKKETVNGLRIKVNPKGDIWEYAEGKFKGEQLFTYYSAIRETKKAGKRMPTDEEWNSLRDLKDIPNLVLAGYRSVSGSFDKLKSIGVLWSSTQNNSSSAWYRSVYSGSVLKNYNYKVNGFSVRCVK